MLYSFRTLTWEMIVMDRPARMCLPDLAVADLALDLARLAAPSPSAPLTEVRKWQRDCEQAAEYMRRVQTQFATLLCRFCLGFATVADQPCPMCEATGFSTKGLRQFRSHHNGK